MTYHQNILYLEKEGKVGNRKDVTTRDVKRQKQQMNTL